MVHEDNRLSEKVIWCLTTLLLASFYIFNLNTIGSLILLCITFLIFIISAGQNHMKIKFRLSMFHVMVFSFALFCLVSSIWAWNAKYAIEKGITILELLVCMSVLYAHYSKYDSIKQLVDAILWAGYIVTIYTFLYDGLETVLYALSSGTRLGSSFANINNIAMFSAITIVIAVFKALHSKKWVTIETFLALPSIVLVAASGSRKALVLMCMGVILVYMAKNTGKNIFSSIFKWMILLVVAFFVIRLLLQLPIFSTVTERMESMFAMFTGTGKVDHSALLRKKFVRIGIEQFKQTPIIGIGIGNPRLLALRYTGHNCYLHNNFAELLAGGGIIGFCLFYGMYAYNIYWLLRFRNYQTGYVSVCIVLILSCIAMDYGAVSYYFKDTYFYLMMYFLFVNILKKNSTNYTKKRW